MEAIIDEMLEREEFKGKGLSRYDMLVLMYKNLSDRFDSVQRGLEDINDKYVKAMEKASEHAALLDGANKQIAALHNSMQLLADERNQQEARHSGQIEDMMVRTRSLETAINGDIN